MRCPRCERPTLEEALGPKGVVVDVCRDCGGVWLDKGEVYAYTDSPRKVFQALERSYRRTAPAGRDCPRCREDLREFQFPGSSLMLDACPKCGGNWFDPGEIERMNELLGSKPVSRLWSPKPASRTDGSWREAVGAPLAALPSLWLRSAGVMAALYGALVAFLFALSALGFVTPDAAIASGVAVIVFQFFVGPILMDWSLAWMHSLKWIGPDDLPGDLRDFLYELCAKEGIPFPKLGVIDDGNPNAFTYGRTPRDARLVFTKGLFAMLEPAELRAVAAHEVGHIVHWDMAVMTAASLVPLILYYIYRVCMRSSRSSSSNKKGNPLPLIGIAAFLLYLIAEYFVLWLGRVRELYADRYSGHATGEPNDLSSALIKIAYGLAGRRAAIEGEGGRDRIENAAAKQMGIFDAGSAKGLAAVSSAAGGGISAGNMLGAMQWDLWNPWAAYYELHSTHPLPARRIELLGRQSAHLGKPPMILFDLEKPESYLDEFLVDLFFMFAPLIFAAAGGAAALACPAAVQGPFWAAALAGAGIGYAVKLWFSYRVDFFPETTVASVLKRVKVSGVRGVPVRLEGTIIGRGSPGFVLSEDMVLQDDTGFVLLDYEQPLALFNWGFALTKVPGLIGRKIAVEGWYRRAPVPFIELRARWEGGKRVVCRALEAKIAFAALLLLGGLAGLSGLF